MNRNKKTMGKEMQSIIFNYFAKKTSPEEEKVLLEWIKSSPENMTFFYETKLIMSLPLNSIKEKQSLDSSFKSLCNKLELKKKNRSTFSFKHYLTIGAGIAAIFVGVIFYLVNPFISSTLSHQIIYTNTIKDSIMQIVLDDQTIVWIGENTTLSCPITFSEKKRIVSLKGYAFFEVAKDSLHPFIVKAPDFQVSVLGTSFGVNTNYDNEKGETILLKGSVRLEKKNGETLLTLDPGQQVLYSKNSEILEVNKIDVRKYALWRFGLISLTNVSIQDIIKQLEGNYQVRIKMNIQGLEKNRYNFSFSKKKGIENALKDLHFLTGRNIDFYSSH